MKKYTTTFVVLVLTLCCLAGCRGRNNTMTPTTVPATQAPTVPATTPATTPATEKATTPTTQTETRGTESTGESLIPGTSEPVGTDAADSSRSRSMPKTR